MSDNALREIPLLASLSDENLSCLTDQGQELLLDAGEVLFNEGDAPSGLYVLIEGGIEITKRIGGQEVTLADYDKNTFVGEISLLTGQPHNATARTTRPSRILKFQSELFEGFKASPVAVLMVSTMAERLRDTEMLVQQQEKLSALGKMSAGLAHELNNPASASLRAARQLPDQLNGLQRLVFRMASNMQIEQLDVLNNLQDDLVRRTVQPIRLNTLEQSEREDELASWIDMQGLDESWRLAPALATGGFTVDELDALRDKVGDAALPNALDWIVSALDVLSLLYMIETSTSRIVDLIKSVKAYSYMDQSPVQEVDVHDGIENTLIMLNHKLRNIQVVRQYDRALPRITVFGSELNQVWTNLIDNAIDAMGGKGTIWIRTFRDDGRVKVEIRDNGPGIPENIQSRIFEPFFTTKGVGDGTGLGLDISYRIVVDRHDGSIWVNSEPGDTRFTVCLPISAGDPAAEAAVEGGEPTCGPVKPDV